MTQEISLSTLSKQLGVDFDTLEKAVSLLSTGRLSRALILDVLTRHGFAPEPALQRLIYFEIEALSSQDTFNVLSVLRQALET